MTAKMDLKKGKKGRLLPRVTPRKGYGGWN